MIPIIAIHPQDSQNCTFDTSVSNQIHDAARKYGFFILRNHGIPSEIIERVFGVSEAFFNQKLERKLSLKNSTGGHGYVGVGQEKLDGRSFDKKEALNIRWSYRHALYKEFNDIDQNFEAHALMDEFWYKCQDICTLILECMTKELGISDRDFFSSKHRDSGSSATTLRLLHYDPIESNDLVDSCIIRAGTHSDYGSLTLLFQNSQGGLQVKLDDGSFLDVPGTNLNDIVVNIGDLLQFWTGNVYKSAQHRVIAKNLAPERYSIAFFLHPEDNVSLDMVNVNEKIDEKKSAQCEEENKRMMKLIEGKNSLTAAEYLELRLNRSHVS